MTYSIQQRVPFFLKADNGTPLVDWRPVLNHPSFLNLEPPSFQGLNFVEKKIISLCELQFDWRKNQIRALGTKAANTGRLKASFSRGWDPGLLPPIVLLENGIYVGCDGNHRFKALQELEVCEMPVLVYERKLDNQSNLENIVDMVGLDRNDHPPALGSSFQDFVTAGMRWVNDYQDKNKTDEIPTADELEKWVNSISHSFTQGQVRSIARKIRSKTISTSRVKSWTVSEGKKFVEENLRKPLLASEVEILATGYDEYVRRALWKAIERFTESGDPTKFVIYTKNAADLASVESQRREVVEKMQTYLTALLEFSRKVSEGEDKKVFEFLGALPQVIEEENFEELTPIQ